MDVEIQVAVQFIISFFSGKFTKEKENSFLNQLRKLLTNKFEGHWYPEKPTKGSAYRCLSIENHLDAVIIKAAKYSGIDISALSLQLPKRLDLWIDPTEVSYRIGELTWVIILQFHVCLFSHITLYRNSIRTNTRVASNLYLFLFYTLRSFVDV